jgi:hypothetical protein
VTRARPSGARSPPPVRRSTSTTPSAPSRRSSTRTVRSRRSLRAPAGTTRASRSSRRSSRPRACSCAPPRTPPSQFPGGRRRSMSR